MQTNIDLSGATVFQTFGGECWILDQYDDYYGIQLGNVSFCGIKSQFLAGLAVEAINHLIVNGHDFEFSKSHNGRKVLVEKPADG